MNIIIKAWNFILGRAGIGTPCYIIGNEANIRKLIKGVITTNNANEIKITYQWIDNTEHTFIESQDAYVAVIEGLPTYVHNVGDILGAGITRQAIEEYYQDKTTPNIGSEAYNRISETDIVVKAIEGLEEIFDKDEAGLPWKKILIYGSIVIAIFWLWKSGILTGLLNDIMPGL